MSLGNSSPAANRTLGLVGVSYRSAPLDLRERLAFTEEQVPQALQRLRIVSPEVLLLSTCNRTEVYIVSGGTPPPPRLLAELRDISEAELVGHCYSLAEEDAVRHLLRVASGLDSMVLGETQILGQVRDAFEVATRHGTIGRVLGRILPLALEVGKRARSETAISRRALSPSSAAVELARQALGDLRPLTALVIGAGEAGRATARSLKASGVERVLIANRSPERADQLAAGVGARAVPYAKLNLALQDTDILIAATDAADHVVTAEMLREVAPNRDGRRLLCIDIAVPRNIDPAVAQVPSIVLYNIDDLETVCAENLRERAGEVASVEAIVEEGMADFWEWRAVEPLVPTIGALYQQAEAVRRAELARTLPRLPGLSEQDRDLIEVMTASIVQRLLHGPVAALKSRRNDPDAPQLAALARELFALPEDGAEDDT